MMKEKTLLTLSVIGIFLYLSPLLLLGEGSHVRIHDNLDSNLIWYKTLVESGKVFAENQAAIPNMMNGLPRAALDTEWSLFVLLFSLFEPFTAYTINAFLMRFIAFIGMYLLLKKHVFRYHDVHPLVPVGSALAFSLLPFWPFGGLSIAGIPLALYAFLNIRSRQSSWKDWLIITTLPFYSLLVLSFSFFLGFMGVLWLIDWWKKREWNGTFLFAIVLMGVIFLLKQYRLVQGMLLGQGFAAHRDEFSLGHNSFQDTLSLFFENLTTAHTHSESLHQYVIIYIVLFALVLILGKWLKQFFQKQTTHPGFSKLDRLLPALLGLIVIFSFWYALWYWEGMRVLKDFHSLFNTFNFGRVHLLNAVLWYILFAAALAVIMKRIKYGYWLTLIVIVCQLGVLINQHHEIKYRSIDYPSYEEFYSEELFHDIKSYIGEDPEDYRVVSIGMHPAVTQYNGMHTLDFYVTMYPLSYKHEFRKIIEGELEKNETLKNYYDTWGGRVYVFLDEIGKNYLMTKDKNKSINDLDFNTNAFEQMGGDYVLSAVELENAEDSSLELLEVFEREDSPWRIYLYEPVSS
ncbi:Colicin V production protein [Alteribacillus persepolensis]|uniref:Colicin V production protein n=1 Tax=Alteribacillus persepolensis TaxID=568899 RepID=A0A1G8JYQ1_9BACI|nr:DUF6044 family protein [Alteribacillus persepolensis]SDI36352.1 Colicin V production protein [Alteribacillus persepolensis]